MANTPDAKGGFVSQNWLVASMGTLIFVLGGTVAHVFDNRVITLEVWKNETDVSREKRTGELRTDIARAQERIAAMQKWIDEDHAEIKHLHDDMEKMQRAK